MNLFQDKTFHFPLLYIFLGRKRFAAKEWYYSKGGLYYKNTKILGVIKEQSSYFLGRKNPMGHLSYFRLIYV
jgi:hypothetical protein